MFLFFLKQPLLLIFECLIIVHVNNTTTLLFTIQSYKICWSHQVLNKMNILWFVQELFLLVPLKLHQLLVLLLVWLKLLVLPVTAMTVSAGLLNILVSDPASPFYINICSIVYINSFIFIIILFKDSLI